MQLKTILNNVQWHKSFVYGTPRWAEAESTTTIDVPIEPRANSKPICSECGRPGSCYDHLQQRRFEFVPLWGIAVYFVYTMRRVDCRTCGVKVERIPWGDGKNGLTTTYRWFLAAWAKRLSWKGVAEAFGTTWQSVFRAVEHAVSWGLAHRNLEGIDPQLTSRPKVPCRPGLSRV
jgi:transposase